MKFVKENNRYKKEEEKPMQTQVKRKEKKEERWSRLKKRE